MISSIIEQKNRWLTNQVDVQYPTPESLSGRSLYQASLAERRVSEVSLSEVLSAQAANGLEVYLVDFHRLTIMFALEQAKRWQTEDEQALIVEYLTQIIISPDHHLFVGFEHGEPVGAAMVSQQGSELLISDVIYQGKTEIGQVLPLVAAVIANNQSPLDTSGTIFVES